MSGFQGPVPSIARLNPGYGELYACVLAVAFADEAMVLL